ncbi:MAG: Mov34/MPN/PAD-1 family protein [Candidatus Lokiarchaeia archaeon]
MEVIEEQYQKVIEAFPNTIVVDNFISHLKIPLMNEVFLDIDYSKYPKKPKVILTKTDGQIYKKVDRMISSLMSWKKKNTISIVELISEILAFIEGMRSNTITINKDLINGILALCKEHHPREILGLLRVDKGIVTEFILPPGAVTSNKSGVFFPRRMPSDPSLEGTVHSHPNGNPNPSPTDLMSIFMRGRFHIIVAYPYIDLNCVKCFDRKGKVIKLQITD